MVNLAVLALASTVLNVAFVKQWPSLALVAGGLFAVGIYMVKRHG